MAIALNGTAPGRRYRPCRKSPRRVLRALALAKKTLVFFRADDASLSADDGTGALVVVKDLHFMGNFVRVSVIPGDGSENELVKVNLQTLPAGIGPGARMRLHVAPERLMAFRA